MTQELTDLELACLFAKLYAPIGRRVFVFWRPPLWDNTYAVTVEYESPTTATVKCRSIGRGGLAT